MEFNRYANRNGGVYDFIPGSGGQALRIYRFRIGMSQGAMGRKLGYKNGSMVSQAERGLNHGGQFWEKVEKIFGVKL